MNFTINQTNGIRETVNSEFINKLYNLFITNRSSHTISLSGYLYSPTGYKAQMDALNQQYGPDLVIEVPTVGQYILFYDPEVTNVLKTSIGDGEGISQSNIESVTSTSQLGLANNTSITDFREGCLFTGITNASTSFVSGCTNLDVLGIPPNINYFSSGMLGNSSITKVIIKNWQNWTNIRDIQGSNTFQSGYQFYDLNPDGTISIINHLILPEGCNIPLNVNMDRCIIFKNSGLQEITLPTSMTYVGAFEGSSLKYLHFANGAQPTQILSRAFNGCSSLEFNVSNLPTSITTLAYRCFYNCSKITGSLNLHNLIRIDGESFRGSGITGITDLGSITSIPNNCFNSCTSLTSVVLPETCTSIGSQGFYQCSQLSEVTFPSSSTIDIKSWGAFYNCSNLTKINNLQNVYGQLYDRTFAGCPLTFNNLSELTNVTSFGSQSLNGSNISASGTTNLPNTTSIGGSAFFNCTNIKGELTFPNLTTLGESAFQNCTGITSIANLGDINTIPVNCFSGCTNLTSVIFPTTIRTLNTSCFNGCKIGQIILPYGYIGTGGWATVMRNSVGENCRYLQYPSTIQVVGTNDMFRDSGGNINCLIVVQATTPPTTGYDPNNTGGFGDGFSWGRPDKANWYVPDSVVNDYKSATGWSQFADKIYSILQLRIDSPTYWQVYQANKDYGVPAQS